MLLCRSISLEVFLLLLVHQLCAQEYGLDSEEHSEYNSEDGESHGHPDYSKYFSVDGTAEQSSPLAGFAGAGTSDFSSFFAPQTIEFAGTNKKPLSVPPINFIPQEQQSQALPIFSPIQQTTNYHLNAPLKDFFEESQQKQLQKLQLQQQEQQIREEYIKPGPSYISHQLPLISAATANADEVERIPPRPNKPKAKDESDEESVDIYKDEDAEVEKEVAAENNKYLGLLNSKPYVNYNTGKSSSTVSQYPLAAGLLDVSSTKLTPYQKYSFQPLVQASRITDDYFKVQPTEAFNPNYQKKSEPLISLEGQATENVPSHLKNHDCRKLSKPDSGSEDMNCFVCVNADTKSKYTQCSYSSEKEPVQYNQGYSERFSIPAKEGHFRYRRYTDRKTDPYYSIRERSRKSFDEPSIPEDYSAGFQYDGESYDESNPEVSYSEKQSEEIKKNPQNCKKVDKDGSTCTVCRDPKTGGNYEQCSYSSEPSEKKYAYVKEKKYSSDDEPEESKAVPKTQSAPEVKIETSETKTEEKPASKDVEPFEKHEEQIEQTKSPKKRNNDDPILYENYQKNRDKSRARYSKEKYEVPKHFADSIVKESRNKNQNSEDDNSSKDFDEYHFKLFPELSKEESRNEENREEEEEEYHVPESTKQNVEEVLAEFTKKDRSNCKKSEKNGMTCFLCVDKNKIQHEECMFVQESRPQSSHVAYHQLKGIKKLENGEEQPDESKIKPILTAAEKAEFLKKESHPETLEAAASEGVERRVSYKENKDLYKKKRSPKKYKKKPVPEPTLKTPTEFAVGDEEGAYSAETKEVHSKVHGVQLPKYMVEKSEYEQEFDAFSGAL